MKRILFILLLSSSALSTSAGQEPVRANPGSQTQSAPASSEIQDFQIALRALQQRLNRLGGQIPQQDDLPLENKTATQDQAHPQAIDSSNLRLQWDHGFAVQSVDERFRIHLGGNVQFDTGWNAASQTVQFGPGGIGALEDGSVFRRARIRTDGVFYGHFEWMTEFDFANSVENDNASTMQTIGTPSFTNVWIGVNDLPAIGTLRAGWMTEPLGMENYTSSRWLPFMERRPGNGLFISPGLLARNTVADESMTWAAGVFHAQNDNFGFGFGDGEYAVTGRTTGLLWYHDEGARLLHIGISGSHRHLSNGEIRLRGRPSVRTMPSTMEPSLASTGTIFGTTSDILNLECAAVHGPWTLQGEYSGGWIHDALVQQPLGTLFYQGAYFQVLYFLTGEHQSYDRTTGTFGRVLPTSPFNIWEGERGWGAWQVGVRYAYLDLQNKGINGATLHDITWGLNWFLNSQCKVQWNVALDHRDSTPPGSSGWTTLFGIRLALDF